MNNIQKEKKKIKKERKGKTHSKLTRLYSFPCCLPHLYCAKKPKTKSNPNIYIIEST